MMTALAEYNAVRASDFVSHGADTVQGENPSEDTGTAWVRTIDLGADDPAITELLEHLQLGNVDSADKLADLAYPGIESVISRRCGRERRLAAANVTEVDKLIAEIAWERLRKRLRPGRDSLPTTLVAFERLIWAQIGYAFLDGYRIVFSGEKPPVPFGGLAREGSAEWGQDAARIGGPGPATNVELKDALGSIPEEERHVFCLRRIDRFSTAEVAKMTGVVESTVRRQYRRATKKLGPHLSRIAAQTPFGTRTMQNLRPLTEYLERLRKDANHE